MTIVILIYCLLDLLKPDNEAIKQNLFEHITKNYRSTVEFTILYSLFNVYIYVLAFVYSPSENSGYGEQ
jgi:hypothetical protein